MADLNPHNLLVALDPGKIAGVRIDTNVRPARLYPTEVS